MRMAARGGNCPRGKDSCCQTLSLQGAAAGPTTAAPRTPYGSTSESCFAMMKPSWYSTPVLEMLSFRYRPIFR